MTPTYLQTDLADRNEYCASCGQEFEADEMVLRDPDTDLLYCSQACYWERHDETPEELFLGA